jgi:hypothetical protein
MPVETQVHDEIVQTYGAAQRRAVLQTTLTAQRLWRELATADLSGSWIRGLGQAMVRAVSAGQLVAASSGQPYIEAMIRADGLRDDYAEHASRVDTRSFSGTAADGRPLDSLLYLPVIQTKTLIQGGVTLQEAMTSGLFQLQRMVASEVADAGRGAAGVAMVANRKVTGYVRMVRAGACSRCVILAGRWYRWNADFQRHKRCFPAGVVVSGPRTLAATRRWYEGELVILTTASGEELPATGNHPILTRRGWVAANLIQEGDEVVRSLRPEGATPLVVPDHQQMPSRIEDVWAAESVTGVLRGVPTSAEDFHGDGGHGEVDVVGSNRLLWGETEAALAQQLCEEVFTVGSLDPLGILLAAHGGDLQGVARDGLSAHGLVGSLGDPGLLRIGHLGHAQGIGLGGVAEMNASLLQVAPHDRPHDAVPDGDGLLAFPAFVGADEIFDGQGYGDSPRWDALGSQGSVEDALADTRVGLDLLGRLAGQVELDCIVEVRRVGWSGHVYDLNSAEGWFSANGLIVSNCQCYGVPATEARPGRHLNPMSFFNGLSRAEQDRRFGVGGAEAIRNGADIYKVVNAGRSTITLDAYGQKVVATLEGTTRRGEFYQQMRREAEQRTGQRFARGPADVEQGLPRFHLRTPRLTPGEILKLSDDRNELIRLLKRFGYLS